MSRLEEGRREKETLQTVRFIVAVDGFLDAA